MTALIPDLIPLSQPYLSEQETHNLSACINSGWISSQGSFVNEFETLFADFVQTKYAVAVSSGTAALHLALLAMGIGKGDEVIVPNLTFAATANAVIHTGATPILCDIDEQSWTLDCRQLKQLITDKTKAIIPVHLYGMPANMLEINAVAEQHGLDVIEDCAQALGASVGGKKVGSIGKCGCFSFFANKTLTTGEGGMVVTNDEDFWQQLLLYRDHGMRPEKRYWHEVAGLNYRMTNMQASIGVAQISKIDYLVSERNRINTLYRQHLSECQHVTFSSADYPVESVTWVTSILVPDAQSLADVLKDNNVDNRRFFAPLNQQPPYFVSDQADEKRFVASERIATHGISLPTFIGLQDTQVQTICELILQQLSNYQA